MVSNWPLKNCFDFNEIISPFELINCKMYSCTLELGIDIDLVEIFENKFC